MVNAKSWLLLEWPEDAGPKKLAAKWAWKWGQKWSKSVEGAISTLAKMGNNSTMLITKHLRFQKMYTKHRNNINYYNYIMIILLNLIKVS